MQAETIVSAAGARIRGSWPIAILGAAVLALLPALLPGLAEAGEFTREGVRSGEVWRIFTAHWTHWSGNHLAWDLAMLLPLLALAWSWERRRTVVLLLTASVTICAAVAWAMPGLSSYRGLSGLDSALFVHVAAIALRRARASGDAQMAAVARLGLGIFVGKVLLETVTGSALFVDAEGYVPVPLAHLVGGVTAWVLQPWCATEPQPVSLWSRSVNRNSASVAGSGLANR